MGNENFAGLDELEQALQNGGTKGDIYWQDGQLTTQKNPYEESLTATEPLKHGWANR